MKLTKDLFKDVIAYIFSEPGAMGSPGDVEFINSDGTTFVVCYMSSESSWDNLKENFEEINRCKFNGPYKDALFYGDCIRIAGSNDIVTTINAGWRELCFDSGNHFVCKEEYVQIFIDLFMGMESYEIICNGVNMIQESNYFKK